MTFVTLINVALSATVETVKQNKKAPATATTVQAPNSTKRERGMVSKKSKGKKDQPTKKDKHPAVEIAKMSLSTVERLAVLFGIGWLVNNHFDQVMENFSTPTAMALSGIAGYYFKQEMERWNKDSE